MNLVSFALRRPISLVIAVVAVALAGFLALDRMPRDIFPDLGVYLEIIQAIKLIHL